MNELFRTILRAFGIRPQNCEIEPLGDGHIHDTYSVCRKHPVQPAVILQKINTGVFPNVEMLMHNLELVTRHISARHRSRGLDPASHGIVLLETEERRSWLDLGGDGCWRMLWMIDDQVSYDMAPGADIAREGGRAIGGFQWMLSDLEQQLIGDIIPGFHNLNLRSVQFRNALEGSAKSRLNAAAGLIRIAQNYLESAGRPYRESEENELPVRLTHNDTKFNNILFSRKGTATCMIDLDTVMKGYCWYDFGDALRTCACTAPEDERDPSRITFSTEIFRYFAEGYLEAAAPFITNGEKGLLHLAPGTFAYMQGIRFLTDYLAGDTYFKTAYPEHNLVRARAQFTLFERILSVEEEMKTVIEELS